MSITRLASACVFPYGVFPRWVKLTRGTFYRLLEIPNANRCRGVGPWMCPHAGQVYPAGQALSAGAFFGRRLVRAQPLEWPLAHPSEFLRGESRHKHERLSSAP